MTDYIGDRKQAIAEIWERHDADDLRLSKDPIGVAPKKTVNRLILPKHQDRGTLLTYTTELLDEVKALEARVVAAEKRSRNNYELFVTAQIKLDPLTDELHVYWDQVK